MNSRIQQSDVLSLAKTPTGTSVSFQLPLVDPKRFVTLRVYLTGDFAQRCGNVSLVVSGLMEEFKQQYQPAINDAILDLDGRLFYGYLTAAVEYFTVASAIVVELELDEPFDGQYVMEGELTHGELLILNGFESFVRQTLTTISDMLSLFDSSTSGFDESELIFHAEAMSQEAASTSLAESFACIVRNLRGAARRQLRARSNRQG